MTAASDLVRYYENLTPGSVADLGRYYAADCAFKDPFNEVRGVADVQAIFERMFEHLAEPRFVVREQLVDGVRAALVWDFTFRVKGWRPDEPQSIRGMSLIHFDASGRVAYHRDYWDAAEELYEKLPLLGGLLRWVKRRMR